MALQSDKLFDVKSFSQALAERLREEMLTTAEPLVEAAVADIAEQMRKRLAACLVGLIESSYSMERMGTELRITVRLLPEQTKPEVQR